MFHHFYFFHGPATTEIYTLSLHDALPILLLHRHRAALTQLQVVSIGAPLVAVPLDLQADLRVLAEPVDRKSTRLNSSHSQISYAVFCLKKKKNKIITHLLT